VRRRIFVNYRRDDSAAHALNVAQYLEGAFGKRNVFLDIDRMRAGQSFPAVLRERLKASKVMLVMIGPNWLDLRDEKGQRRLNDPADWVRLEIVTALQSGVVLIPVLVGGASLPRKADLPPDLQPIVDQHAVIITTNGFRNEMAGLAKDIRALLWRRSWGLIGSAASVSMALIIGVWAVAYRQGEPIWMPWLSVSTNEGSQRAGTARDAKTVAKDAAPAEATLAANKASGEQEQREIAARVVAARKTVEDAARARENQEAEVKRKEDLEARALAAEQRLVAAVEKAREEAKRAEAERPQPNLTPRVATPSVSIMPVGPKQAIPVTTEVRDIAAKTRLIGKRRFSLHWISWDYFGTVQATEQNGLIRLNGEQRSRTSTDFIQIEGVVTTIQASNFKFLGKITQQVTHLNGGKTCTLDGLMTFAITQNRKYWRLQEPEMDACDDTATSYVDIFF
jgi:hypothetical protein